MLCTPNVMYRCSAYSCGHVSDQVLPLASLISLLPQANELHVPQHGYKSRMPRCSLYLVTQVPKVQGAWRGTVTALHNIAEVGFTTALGPAQVLEVVEEKFPLHQETVGEGKRHFTLAPHWSHQLATSMSGAQQQKYPHRVQAPHWEKNISNLHAIC